MLSSVVYRSDGAARCVFVSQDPARQMRELCEKARMANDVHEFLNAASDENKEIFGALEKVWGVNEGNVFEWLRRCYFRTESSQSIDEAISMHGCHLLRGAGDLFASLSDYLLKNLNASITTEVAREWIGDSSPFTFRPAALDPTLRENVNTANQRYLDSYRPFRHSRSRDFASRSQQRSCRIASCARDISDSSDGIGGPWQVRRCARSHGWIECQRRSSPRF